MIVLCMNWLCIITQKPDKCIRQISTKFSHTKFSHNTAPTNGPVLSTLCFPLCQTTQKLRSVDVEASNVMRDFMWFGCRHTVSMSGHHTAPPRAQTLQPASQAYGMQQLLAVSDCGQRLNTGTLSILLLLLFFVGTCKTKKRPFKSLFPKQPG